MMTSRHVIMVSIITCLLLLVGHFCPRQTFAEMQIFELQHQPVEELVEMVRTFVSQEARVATYKNTLVVNASPSELSEIARLVESYDRVQRMLRITVEQDRLDKDRNREIRTSGHLSDGSVTVDLGHNAHSDKNNLWIDSGRSQANIQAQTGNRQENRQVSQFLTVMEGSPARISVGIAVPFTSLMRSYCRRHPDFVETIAYQNVDTGFEVLPRISGDSVLLDIRPFMAFLVPQHPAPIVFQELASKVRIPLGTWYDLGGQASSQDGLTREILGIKSSSAKGHSSIRLRVDPE